MSAKFRIGMNREMLDEKGDLPPYDMGLQFLREVPFIEFAPFDRFEPVIKPDQARGYDAVIAGAARWNRDSFADGGADRLVHLARWGVGFDSIDVAACTEFDVMLTTTRGALDHCVAESALSFMLACCHRMLFKDRMCRAGGWKERTYTLGTELRDRTLGIVGLGGIGSALVKLVAPFNLKILVFDPFVTAQRAAELGVERTQLDDLLCRADFVSIHCPKTPETTDLIKLRELKLMKPTAYLVNTARGGIVNQRDLYVALSDGIIRGAGIDVFEVEPPDPKDPLFTLDNIIVSPHANSLTEECWRDIGHHACRNLVKTARGEQAEFVINPEVLKKPSFRAKWDRLRNRLG